MLSFFDRGLDELAAGAHATAGARMGATIAVGLIALAFVPWPVCAAWIAAVGVLEIYSWFVTRQQFLGHPVAMSVRLKHVATLIAGVIGWVVLGMLFWRHDTAVSGICAVTVWLSVMGFAQVYAYQSRAGYLLAGVLPAAALLGMPLISPNPALPGALPMWMMILVAAVFSFSGARQTMAARQRYDRASQNLRESEAGYRLLADNVTDVIALESADNKRL